MLEGSQPASLLRTEQPQGGPYAAFTTPYSGPQPGKRQLVGEDYGAVLGKRAEGEVLEVEGEEPKAVEQGPALEAVTDAGVELRVARGLTELATVFLLTDETCAVVKLLAWGGATGAMRDWLQVRLQVRLQPSY